MYQESEDGLERIAIVSEDISRPVDEGFKKATANLAGAIAGLVPKTAVFTRKPERAAVEAEALPHNKLLWGAAFSRRLAEFDPEAIVYVPEAAATPMSMIRSWCLRRQGGGKPVVVVSLQRRTFSFFAKRLLRPLGPGLVLAPSSASLEEYRRAGYSTRRIDLGVDSEVFKPAGPGAKRELRAKYNLPEGIVLLHVGHISHGRNLDLLIDIADLGVKVLVVTSTATRRHQEIEATLGRSSVILMDRYIEHIEEIYRAADGYVFPTFSPSDAIDIPLSVLEAMATNLPVATSDFGGLRDLFAPGEGLFMCSTEAEIIQACKEMLRLDTIATRDKILGLTWRHAAESVLEAIASELP
jgi:glycosyltransferase involved in cell wall biosynthesis